MARPFRAELFFAASLIYTCNRGWKKKIVKMKRKVGRIEPFPKYCKKSK